MNFDDWWLNHAGYLQVSYSGGDAEHIWNNAIKHNCNEGWNAALEHAREEFLQREIDRIKVSDSLFEDGHAYGMAIFGAQDRIFQYGVLVAALEYLKEQK